MGEVTAREEVEVILELDLHINADDIEPADFYGLIKALRDCVATDWTLISGKKVNLGLGTVTYERYRRASRAHLRG